MFDPALLASVHFTETAQALAGFATFLVILIIPALWFFNKKVIKPLSWVLGLKKEDSPTGEEILPIPQQLAQLRASHVELRSAQTEMRTTQVELQGSLAKITTEMHSNGGSTLRDSVDRNERMTKDLVVRVINLEDHLKSDAALTVQTAVDLAAVTRDQVAAATTDRHNISTTKEAT
jgi:hypothetical protein